MLILKNVEQRNNKIIQQRFGISVIHDIMKNDIIYKFHG